MSWINWVSMVRLYCCLCTRPLYTGLIRYQVSPTAILRIASIQKLKEVLLRLFDFMIVLLTWDEVKHTKWSRSRHFNPLDFFQPWKTSPPRL